MIIVEGPDGAGKTTLLNRLKADLNIEVAPRVVTKDAEAMVDLIQWVHMNLRFGFQPMLFDRHRLISEPIYGPALRDKPEPGFSDALWFNEALFAFYKRVRPIVIYCLPPFMSVWENVMSDEDNRIFHTNGAALKQIYFAYFNKAITDHVLYNERCVIFDYTSENADAKYQSLLHLLQFHLGKAYT